MREKHLYRFGDFTLCAEENTLNRNGENIPITPKMFSLLLVLVQHPGRILGKEFLLKEVWPDSFVEEGNITFNIRQLRKVLDDDAQAPQFIETIPRRGYRFMAPVEADTALAPDDDRMVSEAPEPEAAPGGSPRFVFAAIAAVIILVGALAFGGWLLRKPQTASIPILTNPMASEKLSTDGNVFHIALSPDGKNIVYTHRVSGTQSLWLRQLETSNNVPIIPASDDFYGGLAFSPDGNSVYVVRGSLGDRQLNIYRMSIFGGVPQKVIEGTQGWISVSGDGSKISYVRCPYTDSDWCSLYIADSLDGRNEKKLVTRPRPLRIGDNKISPDGKTVAFAAGHSRTSSNEFTTYAVDIETGAEREMTSQRFFNVSYLAWLPDQSGLLMTAMQLPERNFRIWNITSDGEAKKLTSDSETYSRLSLDAEGRSLVTTQVSPDFRLLLYETKNPTAAPRVLGNATTVSFAPEGKLYFSSQRTGNADVWSVNPDGSDLRQLTNDPAAEVVPIVLPYSRSVFFESDRTGVIQIFRMNPDGTNQQQVTKQEGGLPLQVSPDGAWLYYRSAFKNNLRRVSIETGQEEDVLQELGRNLVLSPDLTRVAYSTRQGTETVLTVASFPDGATVKSWRVSVAPNVAHLAWMDDGKNLAYVLTDDAREIGALWFQAVDSDTPRRVADLSGDEIAEFAAFSVSHDGSAFALIKGNWNHDAILFRGLKGN